VYYTQYSAGYKSALRTPIIRRGAADPDELAEAVEAVNQRHTRVEQIGTGGYSLDR
jgi:hypothetical protein